MPEKIILSKEEKELIDKVRDIVSHGWGEVTAIVKGGEVAMIHERKDTKLSKITENGE